MSATQFSAAPSPESLSRGPATSNRARPQPERVVSSQQLLAGAHRIWIEHAAERYLLQVTRSGKLILTK